MTGHAVVTINGRMASVGLDGLMEMAEGLTGKVRVLWLDTGESETLPDGFARVPADVLADEIRRLAAPSTAPTPPAKEEGKREEAKKEAGGES